MKIMVLLLTIFISISTFSQSKQDTSLLSKDEIVGVWQRNIVQVGNGLVQYFRFFKDGSFVLNFDNVDEDLRGLYKLKGKYRLVGDSLFLTIFSRTILEGGTIVPTDPGESMKILAIRGGNFREIREPNPREFVEPLLIAKYDKGHIMIGSEPYFKIPWDILKYINIYPDENE